jgi:thymidylate synthase
MTEGEKKDLYLASKIDGQIVPLMKLLAEQPATIDRTGTGRHKIAGCQLQADNVGLEYPLLLSKKVFFESLKDELYWMLRAETNIKGLKSKIWNAWADENGDLGPIYGAKWLGWEDVKLIFTGDESSEKQYKSLLEQGYTVRGSYVAGDTGYDEIVMYKKFNQIEEIEKDLRNRTCSSRNVVNAWDVGDLAQMKLNPCHFAWQLVVRKATPQDMAVAQMSMHRGLQKEPYDLTLDIVTYQRSADVPVGVPFNIGCYSLLLNKFARVHKYNVGGLSLMMGDTHVYTNQIPFIQQQEDQWDELQLKVLRDNELLHYPSVKINRADEVNSILELTADDIELINYQPKGYVPYPVSV